MKNNIPNSETISMSSSRHKLISLALCFLLFLCWIAALEAKIVEQILVIVNDDIITQTELDERVEKEKAMQRMFYQNDEAQLSAEVEKRRPEILENMIDELLFFQEAVRRGVTVSDPELQQFVSSIKNSYDSPEDFQKALESEGYTEYTFRKERKRLLLRQKLVNQEFGSELEVSDSEARKFYRENRDQFPDKSDAVKLKHIFIKFQITAKDREKARSRAADILKRCRDGADFAEMATNFSDHEPTKMSGGDMGYFFPGMGKHNPDLEKAASQLAVGEISDLIETPAGYDIVKIIDIKENAVRAQRIYIAVWPDQESERRAEEKAYFILEELEKGMDFVELAKEHSDDPQAAEKDGAWKEISIDRMSPGLRKAFDSLDEGEVSRPVKTPLGIDILKIVGIQDLTEDEMTELQKILSDNRLAERLKEYSGKLREKAYLYYIEQR